MASNKFWQQVAEAFGTVIEETYADTDDHDAGAAFANKYNVQVSPYIKDVYSLWHEDGETFTMVAKCRTQKELLEAIRDIKPQPKSFKVEIRAKGETGFYSNSVRLPDAEQAKRYASDIYSRWSGAEEYRVTETNEAPNYTADEYGRLTRIASSEE